MTKMKPILAVFLALMLGVTSITLAAARGRAPAVAEIVICSGFALQTIPVDATGKPTGKAHICPDAVTAFALIALPAPELPPRKTVVLAALRVPGAPAGAEVARPRATARDPPAPA